MFFVIFPSFWDLTLDWVENLLTLLLSFSIPGFIFARVQYTREQFSSTQFLDINCHYPAGLGLYKRLGWTSGPRKYMVAKNAKLQPIWFSAPVSWYLEITLFYMGFWKYVIRWGGDQNDPPLSKSIKIWFKVGKKAYFGKNWLLFPNIYAFGVELLPFLAPKRTQKSMHFYMYRRVPPLDCIWKKLLT